MKSNLELKNYDVQNFALKIALKFNTRKANVKLSMFLVTSP